jgi:hypothetical protein
MTQRDFFGAALFHPQDGFEGNPFEIQLIYVQHEFLEE